MNVRKLKVVQNCTVTVYCISSASDVHPATEGILLFSLPCKSHCRVIFVRTSSSGARSPAIAIFNSVRHCKNPAGNGTQLCTKTAAERCA